MLRLVLFALAMALSSLACAETVTYKPIHVGDLASGRVADGEWVEVSGYAWFGPQGGSLNFNQPSAMVPKRLDLSRLDREEVRRLQSECPRMPAGLAGGCSVLLRGQTGGIGREQVLFVQKVTKR
jgi:hypothetical protein